MPINHTVRAGDCISSIAFERGFFPDTIWNHGDNSDLKTRREDPNVLLPGDVVVVPDKVKKQQLVTEALMLLYARRGKPKEEILPTELLPEKP